MKNLIYSLIFLFIVACSCKAPTDQKTSDAMQKSSFSGMIAADTIIYDVIIRNTNPDDSWAESCLKGLKRTELIDSIFVLIYAEKITALDFDTHQTLKKKDIKKLEAEKDFSRDKIGKIQFKEKWIFDTKNTTFRKEIISMILGYEVYDDSGELRGYKPLFMLNFN